MRARRRGRTILPIRPESRVKQRDSPLDVGVIDGRPYPHDMTLSTPHPGDSTGSQQKILEPERHHLPAQTCQFSRQSRNLAFVLQPVDGRVAPLDTVRNMPRHVEIVAHRSTRRRLLMMLPLVQPLRSMNHDPNDLRKSARH